MEMFSKCCFCINLERGCLIIGLMDLILGIFGILDTAIYRKEQNQAILFFLRIGTCIVIAGALSLIVGVQKRKKRFVLYSIIIKIICILSLILLIVVFVLELTYPYEDDSEQIPMHILVIVNVCLIIILVLQIYFLLVVRTYKNQLRQANDATHYTAATPYGYS